MNITEVIKNMSKAGGIKLTYARYIHTFQKTPRTDCTSPKMKYEDSPDPEIQQYRYIEGLFKLIAV